MAHCWYLLEESGYLHTRSKINIGVFAGSGGSSYLVNDQPTYSKNPLGIRDLHNISTKDILATKISHLLGLIGIAANLNTACSTSLVTVIEACIHLAAGYCEMAIAGGVSLLLPQEAGHLYQEGLIYSKDGYCRVFDHNSSGIIHGSGVGVVLLKPLAEAKKDQDKIIAVIKGYGVNNDGDRKVSYTSPSIIGQRECIVNAQVMAGITSESIDYVECHGTGTRLGDPIEIQALDEAFKYNMGVDCNTPNISQEGLQHQWIIGSVKANIGHADAAAGIAGLIKVCKMIEHKIIPGQINYDTLNPELYLHNTNFAIITESKRWDRRNNLPRMAGVSYFGIGGTNAHLVISEDVAENRTEVAPDSQATPNSSGNYILPLSAKSSASLEAYKSSFIAYLNNSTDDLERIAYTLQLRREHFDHRLAIVCNSARDAVNQLKANHEINRINNQEQPQVILMFPGQGNQYSNMSIDLYQHDRDYKNMVDECLRLANKYTNVQFERILFPALFGNQTPDDINQTRWAQLALFIVEYSLAKLLETLNIHAVSYIGHSIGEYVAATLAGVFSLADAIKVVAMRGQLMQAMPKGAMLSIQASAIEIAPIVKNNRCELAVINSPKNCVASGTYAAIDNLKTILDKLGFSTLFLKVSHAYHSRLMTAASKSFMLQLKQLKLNSPQKRFISNVTGDFITANDAVNPEYWGNQICSPVLFTEGIKTLFTNYENLFFIEAGAGKSSISFVRQHDLAKHHVVQLLNSKQDSSEGIPDIYFKENILSKLWLGGYKVDFKRFYNSHYRRVAKLPQYCFEQVSCWLEPLPSNLSALTVDALTTALDQKAIKSRVIEPDQPDKYYEIAKVFLDVLGVAKISVHDDFFRIGGDSLLAVSVVAKLQGISVSDIFKFRTVANIAGTAASTTVGLHQKLEQVKLFYSKKNLKLMDDEAAMSIKKVNYLRKLKSLTLKKQKKQIRAVLLSGATGHVGCNILYQLLHETGYQVYLPIRAVSSEAAFKRINDKYSYYFDVGLDAYQDRITVFTSDLARSDLGLSTAQYEGLVAKVDSIIHSAAIVKQHGDYHKFYQANVQATINLLELAKKTKGKDFHYISTIAVLVNGYVPNRSYYLFDEEDNASILLERNNVYARTKYEGEQVVDRYRENGITGSIYRLGNVAMHSSSHRHQVDIEDNAFFVIAKTIQNLGITAPEIDEIEVSPVDHTALAIVRLFDQVNLGNMTHHVFNPYFCRFSQLLVTAQNAPIKICSINGFIDNILQKLNVDISSKLIELLMLHKKWLQRIDIENFTQIELLQDRTSAILSQLKFYWSVVTREMWFDVMKVVK